MSKLRYVVFNGAMSAGIPFDDSLPSFYRSGRYFLRSHTIWPNSEKQLNGKIEVFSSLFYGCTLRFLALLGDFR